MGIVPCPGDTLVAVRSRRGVRPSLPRRIALLAPLMLVSHWAEVVQAQPPALSMPGLPQRGEAIRALPLDSLQEPVRSRVAQIVSKPTFYRRLPASEIACDRELYAYLVQYPEVVVNIWQLMDVTRVTLNRVSPAEYEAMDGAGTTTRVAQLYSAPGIQLFLAEGFYEGPLFRNRLTGSGVLLLRSTCNRADGGDRVSSTLDVFVSLDNVGAEVVAKTLQPLVGRSADFNFTETTKFVAQVSQAAESNGPGLQRLAASLNHVQPEVRDGFARVVDVVYQRAVLRGESEQASGVRPGTQAAVASGWEREPAPAAGSFPPASVASPPFRR